MEGEGTSTHHKSADVNRPKIREYKTVAASRKRVYAVFLEMLIAVNAIAACSPKNQVAVQDVIRNNNPTPELVSPTVDPSAVQSNEVVVAVPTQAVDAVNSAIELPEQEANPLPPDPFFETAESFILSNPTERVPDAESATAFINILNQRLIQLGIIEPNSLNITVSFEPSANGKGCYTNPDTKHITCYEADNPYEQIDLSVFAHEHEHLIESGTSTKPISELKAAMAAFIISGGNQQILDRYLFRTSPELSKTQYTYSASDLYYGLRQQGLSDIDILKLFSYGKLEDSHAQLIQPLANWYGTVNPNVDLTQYGRKYVWELLIAGRLTINPNSSLLPPGTQIDPYRANMDTGMNWMNRAATDSSFIIGSPP